MTGIETFRLLANVAPVCNKQHFGLKLHVRGSAVVVETRKCLVVLCNERGGGCVQITLGTIIQSLFCVKNAFV